MSSEPNKKLLEAAAAILEGANGRLGITALNKALFYLDLIWLRDTGETLTGTTYVALEQGPVVAKYPRRLVEALEKGRIARQEKKGLAKPLILENMPDFQVLLPAAKDAARHIAEYFGLRRADEISEFSHENDGWKIAREAAVRKRRGAEPIDMTIALSQLIDEDPWLETPLSEEEEQRVRRAATGESVPW